MTVTRERAVWLGRCILPHEAALRQWLMRRPAAWGMDVDDVVQEAYAVLATLERVDHILRPRNYLFEVAKSIVLQSLRRSRVVAIDAHPGAEMLNIPEDAPSPERVTADRQELARVAAGIDALPDRCREVFTLRKLHGLSQREAAKRLGISESTVEKHMAKALALLTEAIARGGNHRDPASKGDVLEIETQRDEPRRQSERA